MFCPYCGKQLPEGKSSFCVFCGHTINDSDDSGTAPVSAAPESTQPPAAPAAAEFIPDPTSAPIPVPPAEEPQSAMSAQSEPAAAAETPPAEYPQPAAAAPEANAGQYYQAPAAAQPEQNACAPLRPAAPDQPPAPEKPKKKLSKKAILISCGAALLVVIIAVLAVVLLSGKDSVSPSMRSAISVAPADADEEQATKVLSLLKASDFSGDSCESLWNSIVWIDGDLADNDSLVAAYNVIYKSYFYDAGQSLTEKYGSNAEAYKDAIEYAQSHGYQTEISALQDEDAPDVVIAAAACLYTDVDMDNYYSMVVGSKGITKDELNEVYEYIGSVTGCSPDAAAAFGWISAYAEENLLYDYDVCGILKPVITGDNSALQELYKDAYVTSFCNAVNDMAEAGAISLAESYDEYAGSLDAGLAEEIVSAVQDRAADNNVETMVISDLAALGLQDSVKAQAVVFSANDSSKASDAFTAPLLAANAYTAGFYGSGSSRFDEIVSILKSDGTYDQFSQYCSYLSYFSELSARDPYYFSVLVKNFQDSDAFSGNQSVAMVCINEKTLSDDYISQLAAYGNGDVPAVPYFSWAIGDLESGYSARFTPAESGIASDYSNPFIASSPQSGNVLLLLDNTDSSSAQGALKNLGANLVTDPNSAAFEVLFTVRYDYYSTYYFDDNSPCDIYSCTATVYVVDMKTGAVVNKQEWTNTPLSEYYVYGKPTSYYVDPPSLTADDLSGVCASAMG